MYLDITHTISEGVADLSQIFFQVTRIYQNDLAMRSTADVTGGKPPSQSIRWETCKSFSVFHDVHRRTGEVLFFCSLSDTTRLICKKFKNVHYVFPSGNFHPLIFFYDIDGKGATLAFCRGHLTWVASSKPFPPYYKTWFNVNLGLKLMPSLLFAKGLIVTESVLNQD
jgi:hypothetical protein